MSLPNQLTHISVEADGPSPVAPNNSLPIVHILLAERNVESIGMARSLDVGAGSAFPEHGLDGVAGNQMDQQEHRRHHKPDDRQSVEQSDCDVTEHQKLL